MRIRIKEFMEAHGIESKEELLEQCEEWSFDGVCPALCSEDCDVEPDGECPHGAPSVLLAVGLI